ncbi:MAG: phenylalanine--tRNA ligase subunit beta [Candidatus Omnitrophota bacterium]
MRISYNWLKEYIDIKVPAEKLAEMLTMAGATVESVEAVPGDSLLEIEVTANRPDWLSYIGVARELSAITGAKLKTPEIKGNPSAAPIRRGDGMSRHCKTQGGIPPWVATQAGKFSGENFKITVEDKALCPRYTARIIRNVKVGESPAWLKTKIEAMGLRPVNNIVDVTNFCLFETGEPMHAFDLDSLEGGAVNIRKAKQGEKIIAIDNAAKTLDGTMLVIADSARPVAIAGVMGGINTEVSQATKNILLEAAFFDPISIRRTARKLSISTESSYRFERRVDMANIAYSSDRAAALIAKLTGGEIGEFVDIGKKSEAPRTVEIKCSRFGVKLGADIPASKIKKILSLLGLKAKTSSGDKVKFEIPSFRYDLNNEIDLIEEVARIYGYDNIPETIPPVVEQPIRLPRGMEIAGNIRAGLIAMGANEIITYSLLGRKLLAMAAIPDNGIVEIVNPLTSEQEIMRPSLIPGMLNAILWNMNRKTKDLKLFELGNIYVKEGGKVTEKKHLSIGIAGSAFSSWAGSSRESSFFDVKGAVETLLSSLGVENVTFKQVKDSSFSSAACASIEIDGKSAGIIGEASRKVLAAYDIKDKVYVCELCVEPILQRAMTVKRFVHLPKYPSVYRDISIVVGKDVTNSDLIIAIKSAGGNALKETKLIDRYIGKQIPDGKVSLTYRLEYRDLNKTLEEREISLLHSGILRALEEKFGAKLR